MTNRRFALVETVHGLTAIEMMKVHPRKMANMHSESKGQLGIPTHWSSDGAVFPNPDEGIIIVKEGI